jgi:hypothetical protein
MGDGYLVMVISERALDTISRVYLDNFQANLYNLGIRDRQNLFCTYIQFKKHGILGSKLSVCRICKG